MQAYAYVLLWPASESAPDKTTDAPLRAGSGHQSGVPSVSSGCSNARCPGLLLDPVLASHWHRWLCHLAAADIFQPHVV